MIAPMLYELPRSVDHLKRPVLVAPPANATPVVTSIHTTVGVTGVPEMEMSGGVVPVLLTVPVLTMLPSPPTLVAGSADNPSGAKGNDEG